MPSSSSSAASAGGHALAHIRVAAAMAKRSAPAELVDQAVRAELSWCARRQSWWNKRRATFSTGIAATSSPRDGGPAGRTAPVPRSVVYLRRRINRADRPVAAATAMKGGKKRGHRSEVPVSSVLPACATQATDESSGRTVLFASASALISSRRAHSSWPSCTANCCGVLPSCVATAQNAASDGRKSARICWRPLSAQGRHAAALYGIETSAQGKPRAAARVLRGPAAQQQAADGDKLERADIHAARRCIDRSAVQTQPRRISKRRRRERERTLFFASLLAPQSTSSATHATWPLYTAKCSGVL
jgi:hypothetical protein